MTDSRLQEQFTERLNRDLCQEWNGSGYVGQPIMDASSEEIQFFPEEWSLYRLDLASQDMFDDFITLVDSLLNEIVAGHCSNEVEARDVRFIMLGEDRQSAGVLGCKGYTAFL